MKNKFSPTEANIRYAELIEEYINVHNTGKMTDVLEERFFHDMEDFAWDITPECKTAADKRISDWYKAKEL